jgi:LCP family protein required for cell wall assembly
MQTPPERAEKHRSPFAAAFFSSIQPGLGQIYAGRWARGLAWAAPTILFYAFTAGVVRSMGLTDFVAQFLAPSWLLGLLVFLAIDLVYRILSAIDAYRIAASTPARKRSAFASLSVAGLIAVVLVMSLAHVALGQTVFGVYNGIIGLNSDNSGDDNSYQSPDASLSELLQSILPNGSLPPVATDAAGATATSQPTPSQAAWSGGNDRLNILLVGSDAGRANVQEYLTDTMMVLSIDPPSGRMALISLPRDTQGVPLPSNWPAYRAYGGAYPSKINTLYTAASHAPSLFPVGTSASTRGFDALKGALGTLYGINISYYVAVDLTGFRDVINTLGGVMIDVQIPVYDPKYPANEGKGSTKLYIPPGIQFMDGSEALAYARARHTTTDFDRAARQQRVLASVREQTDLSTLLAPGVINQLFGELKQDVRTDIPPELFPQLVGLAQNLDFNNRISLVLTPPTFSTECYAPVGESGPGCPPNSPLYLLIANVPAIRNAVHNIFNQNPAQERQREQISAEAATVSVLNGTPSNNALTTRIADTLTTYGINALVPPVNSGFADRRDYTDTVITAWNGAEDSDSTTLSVLGKLFKVTPVTGTDPNQTADITVVVGTNTQSPPRQQ